MDAASKPRSAFRSWIYHMWSQNREERLTYQLEPVNIAVYWQQNKFWLKNKYRQQKGTNHGGST